MISKQKQNKGELTGRIEFLYSHLSSSAYSVNIPSMWDHKTHIRSVASVTDIDIDNLPRLALFLLQFRLKDTAACGPGCKY
jgi:hypothetical protein